MFKVERGWVTITRTRTSSTMQARLQSGGREQLSKVGKVIYEAKLAHLHSPKASE